MAQLRDPLLLCLALLSTLIGQPTGTVWDVSTHPTMRAVISHVTLLHTLTGHPSNIDYPMWSIAVEWQIYLLFPLILLSWRAIGPLALAIGLIPITLAGTYLTRHGNAHFSNPQFLWLFVIGMVAMAFLRGEFRVPISSLVLASAGLACAVAVSMISSLKGEYFLWRYQRYLDFPLGVSAFCLVAFTAKAAGAEWYGEWATNKKARNKETEKDADERFLQNIQVLQRTSQFGRKIYEVGKRVLKTKGAVMDLTRDANAAE